MYLIVISKEDIASINIHERLLELFDWELQDGLKFDGNDIYTYHDSAIMVTINPYHLFFDDVAQHVHSELVKQDYDFTISAVFFASKHRSASGMKTLTVHPVGNYSKAEYGGRAEELVPAAPHLMTAACRFLRERAFEFELPHAVTFEVTHHGPYLDEPSFFIEIGSDEDAWEEKAAAQAIAKTIMDVVLLDVETEFKDFPMAIGVGGGHYAPRYTDVARKKCISFGHMIPNYALEGLNEQMLIRALECTPNANTVYFHRKALKKERYRELKTWYEEHGNRVVRADDLEDI